MHTGFSNNSISYSYSYSSSSSSACSVAAVWTAVVARVMPDVGTGRGPTAQAASKAGAQRRHHT